MTTCANCGHERGRHGKTQCYEYDGDACGCLLFTPAAPEPTLEAQRDAWKERCEIMAAERDLAWKQRQEAVEGQGLAKLTVRMYRAEAERDEAVTLLRELLFLSYSEDREAALARRFLARLDKNGGKDNG